MLVLQDASSKVEEDVKVEWNYVDRPARDAESGYVLVRESRPDLVLLNVMLPRMNGFDLCRRLRWEGADSPILMRTARGQEIDRVMGLDLGADDSVV